MVGSTGDSSEESLPPPSSHLANEGGGGGGGKQHSGSSDTSRHTLHHTHHSTPHLANHSSHVAMESSSTSTLQYTDASAQHHRSPEFLAGCDGGVAIAEHQGTPPIHRHHHQHPHHYHHLSVHPRQETQGTLTQHHHSLRPTPTPTTYREKHQDIIDAAPSPASSHLSTDEERPLSISGGSSDGEEEVDHKPQAHGHRTPSAHDMPLSSTQSQHLEHSDTRYHSTPSTMQESLVRTSSDGRSGGPDDASGTGERVATNAVTTTSHRRQHDPSRIWAHPRLTSPLSSYTNDASAAPGRPRIIRTGSDPIHRTQASAASPHHRSSLSHQADLNDSPVAGPSTHRSRRNQYADPDQHWLSEDEGESFTNDVLNHRRRPRGGDASHRHDDHDNNDGKDGDGTKRNASQHFVSSESASSHAIHHRPAALSKIDTSFFSKDALASITDWSLVLPNLLKHLQCPTCSELLQDPTTLVCGHSLCLVCTIPTDNDAVVYSSSVPLPTEPLVTSPPSQPATIEPTLSPASPTNPSGNPSPGKKHVTVVHSDTICPLSSCRRLTKAKAKGRSGLHIDYALHKVTSAVAEYLATNASTDEDEQHRHQQISSIREIEGDGQDTRDRSDSHSSFSSPSSSPEEIPNTDDGAMKRNMGNRRDGWLTSKRTRMAKKQQKQRSLSSRSSSTVPYKPSTALVSLVNNVVSELECQVCVTLLLDPLTTPCGHTFCKKCLFHSLDHSTRCPLCRSDLPGFEFFVTAPINQTISSLILDTFPALHAERKQNDDDDKDNALDTPIFVCMVSFPHMPTNLHIYEPRYRLMMRRAMDTNKRFGMVLPSRANGGFSQYGTMLEIRNMTMFDDGRSVVETVGLYRFKVLESGLLDGYTVARIERIEDIDDDQEAELERAALARSGAMSRSASKQSGSGGQQTPRPSGLTGQSGPTTVSMPSQPSQSAPPMSASSSTASTQSGRPAQMSGPSPFDPNADAPSDAPEVSTEELVAKCREFVEALRTGSTPWLLQRLNSSLPPMPDDPRKFTWWMAMLMPIDDHEKAKLLQITSYRLRLRLLVFWIQQMQQSWWFNRGCSVS